MKNRLKNVSERTIKVVPPAVTDPSERYLTAFWSSEGNHLADSEARKQTGIFLHLTPECKRQLSGRIAFYAPNTGGCLIQELCESEHGEPFGFTGNILVYTRQLSDGWGRG